MSLVFTFKITILFFVSKRNISLDLQKKIISNLHYSQMLVCHCNGVTEKEIIKAIKKKGAVKLEHIQKLTGAGTGCGRCIPVIDDLIEQHKFKQDDQQLKLEL